MSSNAPTTDYESLAKQFGITLSPSPATPDDDTTQGNEGWWTPDRINQAVNHLQQNAGLSPMGAKGLVARWAGVESRGGPSSVNPTSGAIGIGQWLGARKNGVPSDFQGQLNHVTNELNTTESAAAKRLRNAQTPEEAATGASMYERAEGYNPATGRDNFVNPTIQTMGRLGAVQPQTDYDTLSQQLFGDGGSDFDAVSKNLGFDAPAVDVSTQEAAQSNATDYDALSKSLGLNTSPPPVPESTDTITAQAQAAADPTVKARAAVLTTDPSQNAVFGNMGGFQAFPVQKDGQPDQTLWVNTAKAAKLKLRTPQDIQQYITKNPDGITQLTGTAVNVGDQTSQGAAVQTTAPNGTELSTKVVTDPQTAQQQIQLDQDAFPGSTSQVLPTQDAVANRIAGQPIDPSLAPVADALGNSPALPAGVDPNAPINAPYTPAPPSTMGQPTPGTQQPLTVANRGVTVPPIPPTTPAQTPQGTQTGQPQGHTGEPVISDVPDDTLTDQPQKPTSLQFSTTLPKDASPGDALNSAIQQKMADAGYDVTPQDIQAAFDKLGIVHTDTGKKFDLYDDVQPDQQLNVKLDSQFINEVQAAKANREQATQEADTKYASALRDYQQNNDADTAKILAQRDAGYISPDQADKQLAAIPAEKAAQDEWLQSTGYDNPQYRADHSQTFQQDYQNILNQFGSFTNLQKAKAAEDATPGGLKLLNSLNLSGFTGEPSEGGWAGIGENATSKRYNQIQNLYKPSSRLSDAEIANSKTVGNLAKQGETNPVATGATGLTFGVGSDIAQMAAGGLRYPGFMLDWATGGKASDWLDRLGQQAATANAAAAPDKTIDPATGQETWGSFAQRFPYEAGSMAGQLPGLVGSTILAGGNPVAGFALHSLLSNSGKPINEQAGSMYKNIATAMIFEGGPLVEGIGGKLVDSIMSKFGIDVASKPAEYVQKLFETGKRIGFVAPLGAAMSPDDPLMGAINMGITELGLSAFGHKPTDADLAKLDKKIITLPDADNKPHDILFTKTDDGKLVATDVTGKVPDGIQQGIVAPKEVADQSPANPANAAVPDQAATEDVATQHEVDRRNLIKAELNNENIVSDTIASLKQRQAELRQDDGTVPEKDLPEFRQIGLALGQLFNTGSTKDIRGKRIELPDELESAQSLIDARNAFKSGRSVTDPTPAINAVLKQAATDSTPNVENAPKVNLAENKDTLDTQGNPVQQGQAGEAAPMSTELADYGKEVAAYPTADDAFKAFQDRHDIPPEIAQEFGDRYGDNKNNSPRQAFDAFYNEVKGTADSSPSAQIGDGPVAPQDTASGTKEPWQMTRNEYVNQGGDKDTHRQAVENAFSSGKTIAPDVLQTYPWLAAREAIKPYVGNLGNLSDKELKAEAKKTANDVNAWANKTPNLIDGRVNPELGKQAGFEVTEKMHAVDREIEARKNAATESTINALHADDTLTDAQRADRLLSSTETTDPVIDNKANELQNDSTLTDKQRGDQLLDEHIRQQSNPSDTSDNGRATASDTGDETRTGVSSDENAGTENQTAQPSPPESIPTPERGTAENEREGVSGNESAGESGQDTSAESGGVEGKRVEPVQDIKPAIGKGVMGDGEKGEVKVAKSIVQKAVDNNDVPLDTAHYEKTTNEERLTAMQDLVNNHPDQLERILDGKEKVSDKVFGAFSRAVEDHAAAMDDRAKASEINQKLINISAQSSEIAQGLQGLSAREPDSLTALANEARRGKLDAASGYEFSWKNKGWGSGDAEAKIKDLTANIKELERKLAEKGATPKAKSTAPTVSTFKRLTTEARARQNAKITQMSSGFTPQDIADWSLIAADHLLTGIKAGKELTEALINQIKKKFGGDRDKAEAFYKANVEPHIAEITTKAQEHYENLNAKRLSTKEKYVKNQDTKIQEKIASGDFAPEPKKVPADSPEIRRMQKALEASRQQLQALQHLTDLKPEEIDQLAQHAARLKELATGKDAKGNPVLDKDGKPIETTTTFKTKDGDVPTSLPTKDYLLEKAKTRDYINSLAPAGIMTRIATDFRNSMLTAIHIPVKVLMETGVNRGIEEAVDAAIHRDAIGDNPDVVRQYTKFVRDIQRKTGYDLSSMHSMKDGVPGAMFGEKFVHFEGPGVFRKGEKYLNKAVIDWAHGIPFTAQHAGRFGSFINREATSIAKSEGLKGADRTARATDLMVKAMDFQPTDPIAKQLRAQGQEMAARVTNTNDTWGSRFGQAYKAALNKAIPHLGDLTVPFSKIPGSLISNAIDVSGAGVGRAFGQAIKAIYQSKQTGDAANFRPAMTTLVRSIGGMGAALAVSATIGPDDYDSKRRMVRIGGKNGIWVSTDLLGPIGPAVNGILQAKFAPKGEQGWLGQGYNYGKGVLSQVKELPGISQTTELLEKGVGPFARNFVTGRVPGLAKDVWHSYLGAQEPAQTTLGKLGNIMLPIVGGTKILTNAGKQAMAPDAISRMSADQIKRARYNDDSLNKAMDSVEHARQENRSTPQLEADFEKKMQNAEARNALTPENAQRANELLGLTGDDVLKGNIKAVETPNFEGHYNKTDTTFLDKVSDWAKGAMLDPVDAFDKYFKGESIKRLENGGIIVTRDTKKEDAARKEQGGRKGDDLTLDHDVSLSLGGTNDRSNLILMDKDLAAKDDKIENYLAFALHDGKITMPQAQQLEKTYKHGGRDLDSLVKAVGVPFKESDVTFDNDDEDRGTSTSKPSAPKSSVKAPRAPRGFGKF